MHNSEGNILNWHDKMKKSGSHVDYYWMTSCARMLDRDIILIPTSTASATEIGRMIRISCGFEDIIYPPIFWAIWKIISSHQVIFRRLSLKWARNVLSWITCMMAKFHIRTGARIFLRNCSQHFLCPWPQGKEFFPPSLIRHHNTILRREAGRMRMRKFLTIPKGQGRIIPFVTSACSD